jgi:hypothetical protein
MKIMRLLSKIPILFFFIPISNLLTLPFLQTDFLIASKESTPKKTAMDEILSIRNSFKNPIIKELENTKNWENFSRSREENLKKIEEIVNSVYFQTSHCGYNQTQNILHAIAKIVFPDTFKSDGILDFRYLYCGFCHQRNFLLIEILEKNGYPSELIGLNGHVVGRVETNQELFYVDADYGVGPFPVIKSTSESYIRYKYSNYPNKLNAIVDSYVVTQDDGFYDLERLRNNQDSQVFIFNFLNILLTLIILIFLLINFFRHLEQLRFLMRLRQ